VSVATQAGHRVFNDQHLSWLEILRCLRDTGMPIAEMQRYVELAADDGPIPARLEILERHDAAVTRQIAELHRWQKHLRENIAFYHGEAAS
jgi:DNA-binding transcriptional MerR regulator